MDYVGIGYEFMTLENQQRFNPSGFGADAIQNFSSIKKTQFNATDPEYWTRNVHVDFLEDETDYF